MASEAGGKRCEKNLILHVRLLYACWIITSVSCAYAIWLSFDQMTKLRQEFEKELSVFNRRVVEFDAQGDSWGNSPKHWPPTPDYGTPEVISDEDFVRVKRSATKPKKKTRKQNTRALEDVSKPPTFFYGGKSAPDAEGSGNTPDDWVWLTSYSRIPMRLAIIVSWSSSPSTVADLFDVVKQ
ncbi:hypothetical protein CAPTEDRAFT_192556 [Capitella teleta]|uniref:Uncharacterized protein n=1 Tax=Capitella teleta TaxID=283909 RepID=R7UC97_CAPTE|nr:hypothetical protein CAPTEDRAFT_192556 [Capitella teleta]|eukprot:ELU00887.1 hypothetical protein CAPTEDRAFT_192556 [Capitella teleta]